MGDDRKEKILKIIRDGKQKSNGENTAKQEISITGNHNIAGHNITVIKAEEIKIKPQVQLTPGEGVITDSQAALIKSLVAEIVALEAKVKRKPKTYPQVYGALFRHLSKNKKRPEITQYRMIPIDKFEAAEKYLRTWIGRLSSSKTAQRKDSDWRKRKYAYIHTNIKKYSLEQRLRQYLRERFGVTSLKDLSDDELQKTYQAVAYWKRTLGS